MIHIKLAGYELSIYYTIPLFDLLIILLTIIKCSCVYLSSLYIWANNMLIINVDVVSSTAYGE